MGPAKLKILTIWPILGKVCWPVHYAMEKYDNNTSQITCLDNVLFHREPHSPISVLKWSLAIRFRRLKRHPTILLGLCDPVHHVWAEISHPYVFLSSTIPNLWKVPIIMSNRLLKDLIFWLVWELVRWPNHMWEDRNNYFKTWNIICVWELQGNWCCWDYLFWISASRGMPRKFLSKAKGNMSRVYTHLQNNIYALCIDTYPHV